jgi:hypothetical protein
MRNCSSLKRLLKRWRHALVGLLRSDVNDDRCADRGPVPAELCVSSQKSSAAVAGRDAELVARLPIVFMERLTIAAEVLRPADMRHAVGRRLPVLANNASGGHRLAGDTPLDGVRPRGGLEACPTGGCARHPHQGPIVVGHDDLLGQVDVDPAADTRRVDRYCWRVRQIDGPDLSAVDERVGRGPRVGSVCALRWRAVRPAITVTVP